MKIRPMMYANGALRVALDPECLFLLAEPDELEEVVQRVAADRGDTGTDDGDDRDEREQAPARRPEPPASREDGERPEREPDRRCYRAGHDHPDDARDEREREERPAGVKRLVATIAAIATLRARAESAARSWKPRNDGCRQPAFAASKTSTPANWTQATAVATVLQRTIPPRTIVAVLRPPDEQRYRRNEQGVLGELDEGDNVVVEERVVLRHGPDRLEREPAEQEEPGIQTARPGRERRDRVARRRRPRQRERARRRRPRDGSRPSWCRPRGRTQAGTARGGRGTGSPRSRRSRLSTRGRRAGERADGGNELVSATAALYGGPGRRPDERAGRGHPTLNRRVLPRSPAPVSGGRLVAAVAFGILGTVVAARTLGLDEFGVFATALAAVGFFQALLDLTVEESLTKYGFRYVSAQDWGRLRRLFRQMLLLKVVGGVLASLLLVALAPVADAIFDETGVGSALLAAALLPLVQSAENVGATDAAPAQPLRPPGRVPDGLGGGSASPRSRSARSAASPRHLRRWSSPRPSRQPPSPSSGSPPSGASHACPAAAARRGRPRDPLLRPPVDRRDGHHLAADDARARDPRRRRRASTGRPLPDRADAQTGPRRGQLTARLVLLTEQTRDWEGDGTSGVLDGVRKYTIGAAAVMVVAVGLLRRHALARRGRVRRRVRGSRRRGADRAPRRGDPVRDRVDEVAAGDDRPAALRIVTHGLETLVAIPLVAVLGAEWGTTGAAVAVSLDRRLRSRVKSQLSRLRSDVGD